MARRSIYSRRQSMPAGTYETPLADFLDALPQYINQYQQNQLALQRQELMDKRYEDSVKRQELQDRRAEERQQINTIMNLSRDFESPIDKKKYLVKMVEDNPNLSKYFPANYLSNTLNEEIKFDNSVDDVIDRFTEFKALPDTQKLTNYNQLEDIMSGLQALRPKVRGTKYENKVNSNYTDLINEDAKLKRISGSRFSDDQMSDYLKNELEGIRTTANNLEKEFRKAEADLNKISTFNPATQQYEKLKAENELEKQLEEIGASNWETVNRTYNLARQRFNEAEEAKVNFYENNNLIYPQIVTAESINEAKKRDEMALSLSSQVQSDREKEINKYISDNEPLLLNILNKGEASDELIDSIERFTGIQEGGTDYDEFKNLKDLVAQERSVEEILASAPEIAEQTRIMGVLKEGEDELPTTVATTPEVVTPEAPVEEESLVATDENVGIDDSINILESKPLPGLGGLIERLSVAGQQRAETGESGFGIDPDAIAFDLPPEENPNDPEYIDRVIRQFNQASSQLKTLTLQPEQYKGISPSEKLNQINKNLKIRDNLVSQIKEVFDKMPKTREFKDQLEAIRSIIENNPTGLQATLDKNARGGKGEFKIKEGKQKDREQNLKLLAELNSILDFDDFEFDVQQSESEPNIRGILRAISPLRANAPSGIRVPQN